MELIVKAKHFNGTWFTSKCNCALAKAAKDQFNTINVEEEVDEIIVDGRRYLHEWYSGQFDEDKDKAKYLGYSDEVIRTIELTPIN